MRLKVSFVDAFTDTTFKGNPAAVIVTNEWLNDDLMQAIATENNLSETAFAVKYDENAYAIRWFSPITEIAFCGHATLATAFILFDQGGDIDTLTFRARAVGDLIVTNAGSGNIQMRFPNTKPDKVDEVPADLLTGLSIQPSEVYLNQQAYFAVYKHEEEVFAVTQDRECLKRLAPYDVVVTSTANNHDFVSRYFWPTNGGDEDPVTGSIHAGLAPLWAERLGKCQLSAYQASKRGGRLSCVVDGDRVFISGQAVKYLEGIIYV